MYSPTAQFLTSILHSAETPDEKYELLKQFGYLSDYGLENRGHFVEVVANPKKYINEIAPGHSYNSLSFELASKGFLNAKLRAAHLRHSELDMPSEAERESTSRQPESDDQSSPSLTVCSKCRKLYIEGNKFCGHCGGKIIPLFIQCPKCNQRNGTNTPLCEQCDAKLPSEIGSLPRCPACGMEHEPRPYYVQCLHCQHLLKPLSRCFTCGKYDRTPQPYDIHGCSHGIRVHWSSPPKS